MNGKCPPIESFEDLLLGDPQDPGRRHLDECPRCRARVTAFAAFMQIDPLPDGARMEDARRRLSEAIRSEAGEPGRRARGPSSPFSWLRIPAPIWKPALGLASILLVTGIFLRVGFDRRTDSGPVLRDASPVVSSGVPLVSEPGGDGGIRLRWKAAPTAQGYRLHLYGSDLVELSSSDVGTDTTVTLTAERLADMGRSHMPVIWRIGILRNGDEVALTPPATFRIP